MERRIRTLYIITICAIVAFLAMQVYWVYTRYESSLARYESALAGRIQASVREYDDIRHTLASRFKDDELLSSSFRLSKIMGDTVSTRIMATVNTYTLKAQDLLGLPRDAKLTPEQQTEVARRLLEMSVEPSDSVVFDASSAPGEDEALRASKLYQAGLKVPFTLEGIDSILVRNGIRADCRLVTIDSMVWHSDTLRTSRLGGEDFTLTVPYSAFEGKAVAVTCPVTVFDVLPAMSGMLVLAVLLTVLLVTCLVWQFSTILRLNRLDTMRNSFVISMIHELKRPVSTLKMCVSGIADDRMMSDPEVRSELIGETRSALDNLAAYFSRLRDITFNDSTQIPLNITSFDISALFGEIAVNASVPSGKSAEIRNLAPSGTIIRADRMHLANIVGNLVENSIKYSGPSVSVTLDARVAEGKAVIEVRDNGNGIAEADRERVFDRFFRSNDATESGQPGMGLGLAYVRLLVTAHGGTVRADDADGCGTCIIITLPQ